MIEKLNNKIVEVLSKLKDYDKYLDIDTFLEEFNQELDNIYLLMYNDIYLVRKDCKDVVINFNNSMELYYSVLENKKLYKDYNVCIRFTVYNQIIGDVLYNILNYIMEEFDFEEKYEVIPHIAKHYLCEYYNILDEDDERMEDIVFINDSSDDEIVNKFLSDINFAETILIDYCHEIYELYTDNKINNKNTIKIQTINSIVREKLIDIIDKCILEYQTGSNELIRYYLTDQLDKKENNWKKYAIYILIYDYFDSFCKYNGILDYNIYHKYIKSDDVTISYLIELFKNDNHFSSTIIESFINSYLYIDCNIDNGFVKDEDKYVLEKKFMPAKFLDKFNNLNIDI